MTCKEIKVSIPGFDIAAKTWGNKDARPIMCLHGMMDNAASFEILAPLMKDFYVVAIDAPGTGLSSHYPEGTMPHWKNDAYLMIQVALALNLHHVYVIGHSFGSMPAMAMALYGRKLVKKLVFLDVIGPKVSYIRNAITNFGTDVDLFLHGEAPAIFPDVEAAITQRMKFGVISYQAARALVMRGTAPQKNGIVWTTDSRLKCISATLPYEDELHAMFSALHLPTCLIRAASGIYYPEDIYRARTNAVTDLSIQEVAGGHHVHMDDPQAVADVMLPFLRG